MPTNTGARERSSSPRTRVGPSQVRTRAQSDDIKARLDDILDESERAFPDKVCGLLPRIYAGSNLDRENVTALINLFSKDIFEQNHGGEDLIERVYEYFTGEFAFWEGKRGRKGDGRQLKHGGKVGGQQGEARGVPLVDHLSGGARTMGCNLMSRDIRSPGRSLSGALAAGPCPG